MAFGNGLDVGFFNAAGGTRSTVRSTGRTELGRLDASHKDVAGMQVPFDNFGMLAVAESCDDGDGTKFFPLLDPDVSTISVPSKLRSLGC